MRMMELICPGCGAQLVYDLTTKTAHCEFCGKKLLLIEEKTTLAEEVLPSAHDTLSERLPGTTVKAAEPVREKKTEISAEELEAVRKARLRKAMIESDRRRGITWTEDRADFDAISRAAWARDPVSEYGSCYTSYADEKKALLDLIIDVFTLGFFSKEEDDGLLGSLTDVLSVCMFPKKDEW